MNKNITSAFDLLNGNTVVSHDRRKGTAPKIDFTTRKVREGKKVVTVLRTDYGVSNTMHSALTKLASKVEVVKGRFEYYFAA